MTGKHKVFSVLTLSSINVEHIASKYTDFINMTKISSQLQFFKSK